MGGSVGNAIFGAVLRSVADEELPKGIVRAALLHGYKGSFTTLIPAVINSALGVPGAFTAIEGITPAIETATLSAFYEAYASFQDGVLQYHSLRCPRPRCGLVHQKYD
jgi:hypothetical protein